MHKCLHTVYSLHTCLILDPSIDESVKVWAREGNSGGEVSNAGTKMGLLIIKLKATKLPRGGKTSSNINLATLARQGRIKHRQMMKWYRTENKEAISQLKIHK